MKRIIAAALIILPLVTFANQNMNSYFDQVKQSPQNLRVFLQQMPKGGELHYHWDGSSYPENMLHYARNSDFCYNPTTGAVSIDANCTTGNKLNTIANNPALYQTIVDNWSLTEDKSDLVETNRHVFEYFIGAEPLVQLYSGNMLAEEMQRAADQHETYMELIYILDVPQMINLGAKVPFSTNFSQMQQTLLKTGAINIANDISGATTKYYEQAQQLMHCGTPDAQTGCQVTVRFQISALRNFEPQIVFTQLLVGFLVADKNPLVVGVNIVGPENAYYSGRDYDLHMQMIHYLHQQFPKVHLSLHAGELSIKEAPPEFMQDHIAQAINVAGAERIGHGTDIAGEMQGPMTLKRMAEHHIVAEECLTSNQLLLGAVGPTQPLPLYLHYHVPVVLSTDDEGIFRSTLTQEYWNAVTRYNLSYTQLKDMARNVMTYSFMPGKSLWRDANYHQPALACQHDTLGGKKLSPTCAQFLAENPKAKLQWQLEQQFVQFEKEIHNKIIV